MYSLMNLENIFYGLKDQWFFGGENIRGWDKGQHQQRLHQSIDGEGHFERLCQCGVMLGPRAVPDCFVEVEVR